MAFIETPRFPDRIAYGSKGGPKYQTSVVRTFSGVEQRNIDWQYPLYEFDISYGVKTVAQYDELLALFHACRGRAIGFRFRDPMDYKSCAPGGTITATDQVIGTGDGTTTQFYLAKNYTYGSTTQRRRIRKPMPGTVLIAVNGSPVTPTINTASGLVTFSSAPGNGATITAGFEFDLPCRFDTDYLDTEIVSRSGSQLLLNTSIMVIETRDIA